MRIELELFHGDGLVFDTPKVQDTDALRNLTRRTAVSFRQICEMTCTDIAAVPR